MSTLSRDAGLTFDSGSNPGGLPLGIQPKLLYYIMKPDLIDICAMEALLLHSGHHCVAHIPQFLHNEA